MKSLYLHSRRPYLRDKLSEEQLAKFARGHAVGKIARQLFPEGIEIPAPGKSSAEKTSALIREGCPVIYEACFIANEVIVAVDILVRAENGWKAYEVKSSGMLSNVYFRDAFLQYFVLESSGLELCQFSLIHRNLDVELLPDEFNHNAFIFTILPAISDCQKVEISQELDLMKRTLAEVHSPDVFPGVQCMQPYPCDFRGVCWKKLSEHEKLHLLNQTT
jgi:hypothetical protein